MPSSIQSEQQLIKFANALMMETRKSINELSCMNHRPYSPAWEEMGRKNPHVQLLPSEVALITLYSRIEGIVFGQAKQYFSDNGAIDLPTIQKALYECQQGFVSADANRELNTLFALTSSNVEKAFELAIDDKPLPSEEIDKGPIR